jgi:hypothetical protein
MNAIHFIHSNTVDASRPAFASGDSPDGIARNIPVIPKLTAVIARFALIAMMSGMCLGGGPFQGGSLQGGQNPKDNQSDLERCIESSDGRIWSVVRQQARFRLFGAESDTFEALRLTRHDFDGLADLEYAWVAGEARLGDLVATGSGGLILAVDFRRQLWFQGEIYESAGGSDTLLVEIDALGKVVWRRLIGGFGDERTLTLQQSASGTVTWFVRFEGLVGLDRRLVIAGEGSGVFSAEILPGGEIGYIMQVIFEDSPDALQKIDSASMDAQIDVRRLQLPSLDEFLRRFDADGQTPPSLDIDLRQVGGGSGGGDPDPPPDPPGGTGGTGGGG